MSAIKLIPASGGGSVSLAPPTSTSGADVTFTLPSTSQSFGKILQVLQNTKVDTTSSSSNSFVDTGLSQGITPTYSTSKILCMYSVYVSHSNSVVSYINLVRGSTNIFMNSGTSTDEGTTAIYVPSNDSMQQHVCQYLDSPNTTDTLTYKLQYRAHGGTVYINRYSVTDNYYGTSSLTLMEVAA